MKQETYAAKMLKERGIEFRLIKLSDRAISVDDVVKFSDGSVKADEICKTIVVKDSNNFYALFLLGSDKIDFSKAKNVIGKKISIASADEVKRAAGVEPGAVCPLLLNMPMIIDKKVFTKKKINFGSGDHLHGIGMKPEDLERAIEFRIADISQ